LFDANHPSARHRSGLVMKQRVARLKSSLQLDPAATSASTLSQMSTRLATVGSKLLGATRYEIQSRVQALDVRTKAVELRRLTALDQTPPQPLQTLTFSQLYASVRDDTDPAASLDADAVLFRATQGNSELADWPFASQYQDPDFGWRAHIRGQLQVIDVAGGHVSMLREPHVDGLAEKLQALIDRASAEPR
jgi:thioesterase domain-containing protein